MIVMKLFEPTLQDVQSFLSSTRRNGAKNVLRSTPSLGFDADVYTCMKKENKRGFKVKQKYFTLLYFFKWPGSFSPDDVLFKGPLRPLHCIFLHPLYLKKKKMISRTGLSLLFFFNTRRNKRLKSFFYEILFYSIHEDKLKTHYRCSVHLNVS